MFKRPCPGRITSRFQKDRLDPVSGKFRRDHVGTDFAQPGNITIQAAATGKVILARSAETDGFGKVIFIEHNLVEGKFVTVYAHLRRVDVRAGQIVSQGASIGLMGSTGNSTGQHLHFEVHLNQRFSDNRNAVDAMMYLPLEVALKQGDKGPNVKMIQDLLVKKGHLAKADGSFGPATDKAVKAFQSKNGLVADGLAGPNTMSKLKSVQGAIKKEEEKLELNKSEREELSRIFKRAREKGVFSSATHEKTIVDGTMTLSRLQYLQTIIAGAGINNGKRI